MNLARYGTVFTLGLQNTFVYRWNYFLRALFGLIPLAGTVFLWRAVFNERGGGSGGYNYGSMIYYYLLAILASNLVTPTEDAHRIGYPGGSDQFFPNQAAKLSRLPDQYLSRQPTRLYGGYHSANRAHILLFS